LEYLKNDKTLEELQLDFTGEEPPVNMIETFLVDIAQVIRDNPRSRLQKFQAYKRGSPFASKVVQAFAETAKTNYTLTTLILAFYDPNDDDEASFGHSRDVIDFYLRLNKSGRRRLMKQHGQIARREWIDTLAEYSHDVQCLNYYLLSNPWLCNIYSTSSFLYAPDSDETSTTKRKGDASSASDPEALVSLNESLKKEIETMRKKHEIEKQELLEENQRLRKTSHHHHAGRLHKRAKISPA
jgi:hypothetical protein